MLLCSESSDCRSTFMNSSTSIEMQSPRITNPVYILNHNNAFHFYYREIRNKEIPCGLTKIDILEAFQNLESLAVLVYT